jgi:Putative transposase of IS4/5 family (DUF4096)
MGKELVSDKLWETIEPLLPPDPPKSKGGRPRVPNRAVLAGIVFVLKSGIPWRAGEIPTAEEVPPPRTEDLPMAEGVPSGTPPQAPPGDVQRGPSSEALSRTEESSGEQERQIEQEREDDKGLVDRAIDKLTGEEEQRREGSNGPDRK